MIDYTPGVSAWLPDKDNKADAESEIGVILG
jgi:hypothetical protein